MGWVSCTVCFAFKNSCRTKTISCRILDFIAVAVRVQHKNCASQWLWFAVMGMDRDKKMARELALIDILYSDKL
jgi:hypothetical protein